MAPKKSFPWWVIVLIVGCICILCLCVAGVAGMVGSFGNNGVSTPTFLSTMATRLNPTSYPSSNPSYPIISDLPVQPGNPTLTIFPQDSRFPGITSLTIFPLRQKAG